MKMSHRMLVEYFFLVFLQHKTLLQSGPTHRALRCWGWDGAMEESQQQNPDMTPSEGPVTNALLININCLVSPDKH